MTWSNKTNVLRIPGLGISDIHYDPLIPGVVWASTGLLHNYGAGLLYSSDNGESWSAVDMNSPNSRYSYISKFVIDHSQPQQTSIWFLSGNELRKYVFTTDPLVGTTSTAYTMPPGPKFPYRSLKDIEIIPHSPYNRIALSSNDLNAWNGGAYIVYSDDQFATPPNIISPDGNIDISELAYSSHSTVTDKLYCLYEKLSGWPLRITEVTHDPTAIGHQASFPSYMVGASTSNDFIELTNLGTGAITLKPQDIQIERWYGTSVVPELKTAIRCLNSSGVANCNLSITIPVGGTIIIAFGDGSGASDDPTNRFFYSHSASNDPADAHLPTDAVGYILKQISSGGADAIIDVVALNGFVFPAQSRVSDFHWFSSTPIVSNSAGIILTSNDNNTSSTWSTSAIGLETSFGSINMGLTSTLGTAQAQRGLNVYDFSTNMWTGFIPSNIPSDLNINHMEFTISSVDPSIMYGGGVSLYKYTGGTNWTALSGQHPDVRDLELFPGTSDLLIANDGGVGKYIYSSTSNSTLNLNGSGLNIVDFHSVTSPQNNSGHVVGGAHHIGRWNCSNCDDNSTVFNWTLDYGYDGFKYNFLDEDPNLAIGQGNWTLYLMNGQFNWSYFANYNSYPYSPWPIALYPSNPRSLYLGYKDLFKYDNPRVNSNFSNLSNFANVPDCFPLDPVTNQLQSSIQCFEVSLSNQQTIYVGLQGAAWWNDACSAPLPCGNVNLCPRGKLWKTTNDGSSWLDLTPNLPINTSSSTPTSIINYSPITSLCVSPTDESKVWVTFGGFAQNDNDPSYFRVTMTSDGGSTWIDYSQGLPNLPVNQILYQKGSDDALYLANDAGVYYRNSSMSSWECFNQNLPVNMVYDLDINYCKQKIRAALYSGGIWESPLAPSQKVLSGTTEWTGQTINITSDLIIPSGGDLQISGCTLNIAKGRKITVEAGGYVQMVNSFLDNLCDEMWDGIYLKPTSQIYMDNCTLKNAYKALNLENQTGSDIHNCYFDKNYIGINIANPPPSTSSVQAVTSIVDCNFNCTGNLRPYFGNQSGSSFPSTWSLAGINMVNATAITVGSTYSNPNIFQNLPVGIISTNSNLIIRNTKFIDINKTGIYNNPFDGSAVYANGYSGNSFVSVKGFGRPPLSTAVPVFENCLYGVYANQNVGLDINDTWFNNVNVGVYGFHNNNVAIAVATSRFDCHRFGIDLKFSDQANDILIQDNHFFIASDQNFSQTRPLAHYSKLIPPELFNGQTNYLVITILSLATI